MPLWYHKRKSFMIRLRRGIYRACEFSSRCSETHMRNYTKILRIYGIISTSKPCFASLWALLYRADARTVILAASQKCPCEQAFVLRGITKLNNVCMFGVELCCIMFNGRWCCYENERTNWYSSNGRIKRNGLNGRQSKNIGAFPI